MEYEMEELIAIVGRLAEKYNAHESTSMTYEKAEQLMEAILYCIHETEQFGDSFMVSAGTMPIQRMYEVGALYVEKKVKKALDLYNEMLPTFVYYGNRCLYDTFIKGMPEFFKWYDMRFEPQNTILTLDYPVMKDISGHTGIDKIYEFIMCIRLEQKFLNIFPKDYIINILFQYNRKYEDMIDNICEIVFMAVIGHILAGKSLSEDLEEADYLKVQKIVREVGLCEIKEKLKNEIEIFVQKYYGNCGELLEYLICSIDSMIVRLKNAADNGSLHQMF